MPINYLYIDDEKTDSIEPMLTNLKAESADELNIHHKQVMESIKATVSYIKDHLSDYDGMIIDQDLKCISDEGYKADYYGTTLAQQLRTEMATGNIHHIPLVLLSNEHVIVESFEPDDSSKDLFDYVIKKTSLTDVHEKSRAVKILFALVDAYAEAVRCKKNVGKDLTDTEVKGLLKCNDDIYKYVDSRFIDFIKSRGSDPHALVAAIYSSLVQSAGMLVTEVMLKTKLGIADQSQDWGHIKEKFGNYKYQGPFSDVKERWWFSGIEDWWYEIYPNDVLQSLTCKERVSVLKEKFEIDGLYPIETNYPNGDQSEYLWVNCVLTEEPLDAFDALRVRDPDAKIWEQPKYLSIKAYSNDHEGKYKVHHDDRNKIRILRERLKPDVNE